jgi:hypothetical protein
MPRETKTRRPTRKELVKSLGDYRVADMWLWLDKEAEKEKDQKREWMLVRIRNELSRFTDVQQYYFRANQKS